jgi:restriction endonuclease S subunit
MHFVNSADVRNQMAEQAGGTTRQRIAGGRVKQLVLPVPPLPEQRRIVAKIDSLSGKSKRARDQLDHMPRLVEKYKQAILAAAFSGALTAKVADWHQGTISDTCDLIDGDRGPNYPKLEDYLTSGYCLFLSTKNVRPYGFDFSECQFLSEEKHKALRKGTLSRGDVVITTRGTIGNVAHYGSDIPYDVVRINSGMLILRQNKGSAVNTYRGMSVRHYSYRRLNSREPVRLNHNCQLASSNDFQFGFLICQSNSSLSELSKPLLAGLIGSRRTEPLVKTARAP